MIGELFSTREKENKREKNLSLQRKCNRERERIVKAQDRETPKERSYLVFH